MEQPKEPGFYWACVSGKWEPVKVERSGHLFDAIMLGRAGEDQVGDEFYIEAWGPRIEPYAPG